MKTKKNIALPNIRKMFAPDRGFVMCDADLSGADAQVVAYEADDEQMKDAFRKGLKIHVVNARSMFEKETSGMTTDELKKTVYYDQVKMGCHGTNYGATANSLVENLGWDYAFAMRFQAKWFELHPGILEWHRRVGRHLDGTQCWNCNEMDVTLGRPCPTCGSVLGKTIKNEFGFRIRFFDRPSAVLNEALAWKPQSTVAFCTDLGWTNISKGPIRRIRYLDQNGRATERLEDWSRNVRNALAYTKWGNIVQFLIQVHDSIVFQVPIEYEDDLPEIVKDMEVIVPYKEPLVIPMGMAKSRISWGDVK